MNVEELLYEAHYRRTELLRRLESFTLRGE